MKEQEKVKLEKEYSSLSDDEFIEILSTNKEEFPEGVYEIVLAEGRRRNLRQRMEELELTKEQHQQELNKEWVKVYHIFDLVEVPMIENILLENDIPIETFYYSAAPLYQLYSPVKEKGVILVEKENAEKAKRTIEDFRQAEG